MVDSVTRPNFHKQFIVSKVTTSDGINEFCIGEWTISSGAGYAYTRILDDLGQLVGVFIGSVVDFSTNAFKPDSTTISWAKGSSQLSLEACIYQRAGSWIALVVTPDFQSIYLDACGSIPLVYFPDHKLAGSSAYVLLRDEDYNDDLYPEAKSESWFKADWYHTSGLTAHRSLRRLLPNHRLDLESWTIERIWPTAPFPALAIEHVINDIVEASSATMGLCLNAGVALMPLTAGNETRGMLALAKNWTDKAIFFTGDFPGAIVDIGTASRLAKKCELQHVIVNVRSRTAEQIEVWRRRTGHCIGGAVGLSRMNRNKLASGRVEFSGAAGEVGRGFLWSSRDSSGDKLTSEVLLARLKLPCISRFVIAVDEWLASVEQFDAFTVMDLAYIELKMACWAGPQAPGAETDVPQIWPFSSRRCFAAMMSAPHQVRLEQSLFRRIVEQEWPSLLEIPINKGTMWQDVRSFAHRASSPRRVWNKVRKNFAKLKQVRKPN